MRPGFSQGAPGICGGQGQGDVCALKMALGLSAAVVQRPFSLRGRYGLCAAPVGAWCVTAIYPCAMGFLRPMLFLAIGNA